MNLVQIASKLSPETIKQVVAAVFAAVDAAQVESSKRIESGPGHAKDYDAIEPNREGPPGGWIDDAEIRNTCKAMSEAISLEKYVEGFIMAVRIMSMIKGA